MRRISLALGIFILCLSSGVVRAGDDACPSGQSCYPQRVINQWACSTCTLVPLCSNSLRSCSDRNPCGVYDGSCIPMCPPGNFTSTCYSTGTVTVDCNNTGAYNCSFDTSTYKNCHDSTGSGTCTQPYESVSFGCCGPGGSTTVGCGGSCTTSANCNGGLTCSSGVCRNPECTSESSCSCPSTPPSTYSCSGVTITGPATIILGETATYTVTVNESNGTHDGLTLVGASAGGTVTPTTIGAAPYTFTGDSLGAVNLNATATRAGANVCTGTLPVTVTNPNVVINAWQTNSPLLCAQNGVVSGTVRSRDGAGHDETQTPGITLARV